MTIYTGNMEPSYLQLFRPHVKFLKIWQLAGHEPEGPLSNLAGHLPKSIGRPQGVRMLQHIYLALLCTEPV